MGNINFISRSDQDIIKSIHLLTAESSKLKAALFKPTVIGNDLEKRNIKLFESYINDFLRYWTDHANELQSALREIENVNGFENIQTIEYEYVKRFIYGNYDYASILPFTDGVLAGIKSGDITEPSHVEDFKNHTISLAFNKQNPSVAGLLDSVIPREIGPSGEKRVTALEVKMFETIRNSNDLFDMTDRQNLYKAITKTINYIATNDVFTVNDLVGLKRNYHSIKLFISVVNNVVEYITYSLTAYATRVFIISRYAAPFISSSKISPGIITETVDMNNLSWKDISENPNGTISTVFHTLDELVIKDPKKSNEFFDRFEEFLKLIGADSFLDKSISAHRFVDDKLLKSSKIYKSIENNPLYNLLIQLRTCGFDDRVSKTSEIMEFHQNLKSFLYNKYQGLQGSSTPKNEILHVIRGIEYGNTVKDHQDMAKDIYLMALRINRQIIGWMDNNSRTWETEIRDHNLPSGTKKFIAESNKFLIDLYQELMFAFAQKTGFIERRVNELRASEIKNTIDTITIDIPGLKSDISVNDAMMLSVPDTTRMPLEHTDLYTLPVFESLQMYDEYLRSLPEFANDMYLHETAGVSAATITNKITGLLESYSKRFFNFLEGQEFKLARKWVINNEQKLRSIQYPSNVKMEILPYRDEISPPNGFRNLSNGLKNFNERALQSNDELQKFLRTLYPSEEISKWFADDPAGKISTQRYMNLILFGDKSDQPKSTIPLLAADIPKKMDVWIRTIKDSEATKNGFKQMHDDIRNAMVSVNSKLVNISGQSNSPQQAPDRTSSNNQQQGQQLNLIIEAPTRINLAITRLWAPLIPMFIRAMMNQYNYIKTAYSLGQPQQTQQVIQTPQKGQL